MSFAHGPDPSKGPKSAKAPPLVDATSEAKMKVAQELGVEAFEENTRILKRLGLRALRSFAVVGTGLVAFNIALKRKKRLEDAKHVDEQQIAVDDPTTRYLTEMRSLGFDVDTLEEDIAKSKSKQ